MNKFPSFSLIILWILTFQAGAETQGAYTALEHPVLGEIEIRTDLFEKHTVAELNQMLVEHAASQLELETIELQTANIVLGQFLRELTSSSRALQEKLFRSERTTSYEADFLSEVTAITDPTAYKVGRALGATLDPVTLFLPITKAQRLFAVLDN